MNINLEISNITPNCKSSLSVSGYKTSSFIITELISISNGYNTKTKKIVVALNESIKINESFPFNTSVQYEFIKGEISEFYWVENCEDVDGVTRLTVFGETKSLIKIFGELTPKELTEEIIFSYDNDLQYSETPSCKIQDFTIAGVTSKSVRLITNEVVGKFRYLRIRIKEYGTNNWTYFETTDKNYTIENLKSSTFYYISYMKFCDYDNYSFYSQTMEFKTF
jgi:hypothetical protein